MNGDRDGRLREIMLDVSGGDPLPHILVPPHDILKIEISVMRRALAKILPSMRRLSRW